MTDVEKKSKIDHEWNQRRLCSDESCIGTIGPDGRCRECGIKYEGVLPDFENAAPVSENHDSEMDDEPDRASSNLTDETIDAGDTDDEWENRVLCSDESCIGVIGPDNCCKECGKPYEKVE